MANKKPTSELEYKRAEMTIKEKLAAEPQKTVLIIRKGEKDDKNWHGFINGVGYHFPKGEVITVPESLYKVIKNSADIQEALPGLEKAIENVQIAY